MFCPIRAQCRFVFITNSNSQGALYAWFPLISKSALAAFHNSSKLQLVHMVGRVRGKGVGWSPCTRAPLLSGQPAEKYTWRLSHRPSPTPLQLAYQHHQEKWGAENKCSHRLHIWFRIFWKSDLSSFGILIFSFSWEVNKGHLCHYGWFSRAQTYLTKNFE